MCIVVVVVFFVGLNYRGLGGGHQIAGYLLQWKLACFKCTSENFAGPFAAGPANSIAIRKNGPTNPGAALRSVQGSSGL